MTNLPERPDGTPPVCAHTALAPTCAQDPLAKSGASSISDEYRGKITKPSMRQAALTSVAFTQSMCPAALSCATEQDSGGEASGRCPLSWRPQVQRVRIVGERGGQLSDGEDEDKVKEQLERRDPLD